VVRVETASGRTPSRTVIAATIGLVIIIWAFNFIAAKIGLRSPKNPVMLACTLVWWKNSGSTVSQSPKTQLYHST